MKGGSIAVFILILLLICSNLKAWSTAKNKTDTPGKTDSLIVVRFALKKGTSSDFQYFDKFGSFKRFVSLKTSKDTVFLKKETSPTLIILNESMTVRTATTQEQYATECCCCT